MEGGPERGADLSGVRGGHGGGGGGGGTVYNWLLIVVEIWVLLVGLVPRCIPSQFDVNVHIFLEFILRFNILDCFFHVVYYDMSIDNESR
jgi:hypothetical protein